ncbi:MULTISPECIES: alpha/beta hydrolase [unclassified Beijerinckia]|uniref:alpha/beta fold hydrolase n=1 Tax=unclassified Beijerinckia TaxID=2638183 RepID=UPI000895B313|nr:MULTISPECIES: alpha/beta hydrolase [unclassified Beijerinckia]MDH7797306.1 3-oxoadipate enol-lactonase [Beijerinckia sp. GAS462]SEC80304.1 3-oxoadipate enol-lactonase [Beijerinckia sp. 28-YEA-48]
MPYSTRNGLKIHYEIHGEGHPLVLIHANPFDRRLWLYQIARFSPFYRVIAVDLRGYGLSDKPEIPFTLRDMMDDVLGVCHDQGVGEAIFAGVSVGSGIALLTALDHPERTKAIVLVGGSSSGPRNPETIVAGFDPDDPGAYMMTLMRGYVAPGFADTPQGKWLLDLFVENSAHLSSKCIAQIFRTRGNFDMTARLGEVKTPTLVINGEYDESLEAGRLTASRIANARHVVLPNTGHACCIEDAPAFDQAMISFLADHHLIPEGALKHR